MSEDEEESMCENGEKEKSSKTEDNGAIEDEHLNGGQEKFRIFQTRSGGGEKSLETKYKRLKGRYAMQSKKVFSALI